LALILLSLLAPLLALTLDGALGLLARTSGITLGSLPLLSLLAALFALLALTLDGVLGLLATGTSSVVFFLSASFYTLFFDSSKLCFLDGG